MPAELLSGTRSPWKMMGLIILVLIGVGCVYFFWQVIRYIGVVQKGGADPLVAARSEARLNAIFSQPELTPNEKAYLLTDSKNPTLGSPTAPIHITEFVDYECPYSAQAAPELRAFASRHPNEVFITIREFPIESLYPHAMDSAIAARCVFTIGGNSLYWKYSDILYRHQAAMTQADLRSYAQQVGMDMSAFDECIASPQVKKEVDVSVRDGEALGIKGTPTFFVNGRRVPGALDLGFLEELYVKLYEK